ncbi:ectomycorrhiza-regulated small secreted protein [Mycena rebaudengoi]|nr:ectomycorrhiza-regulated small secreted protein [Mycena rebaudengoi]
MPPPILHPLLQYSQDGRTTGHCCPLLWDLREPPNTARHVLSRDRPLSEFELSQHATTPPVFYLRITCGVFPDESWTSEARNWQGITVRNVLDAIYSTVRAQITYPEWNALSLKHQNRVNLAFDVRWRRSADPAQVREHGVLRSDCLLHHILFSGLSMATNSDDTCLLTLGRPKRPG